MPAVLDEYGQDLAIYKFASILPTHTYTIEIFVIINTGYTFTCRALLAGVSSTDLYGVKQYFL